MSHQDRVVFGNFLAVLGVLVAMAVAFFFIASEIADDEMGEGSDAVSLGKLVDDNIRPIGEVRIAGEEATTQEQESSAPAAIVTAAPIARSGEQIYNGACGACHNVGVAGAPKLGDKATWDSRLPQGIDGLVKNATNGLNAMPPKGLCMDCSEDDLRAAIEYMVSKVQ